MSSIIKDGTGKGYAAKVGSDNRLAVDAITETIREAAIASGDGYNLATGRLTLTSTNESAVFFFENQEDTNVEIVSVFINTSASVGTLVGAQPELKIYRNPTGGTIVDDATDIITISNSNFGSNKVITANIYQGDEGKTLTGNTAVIDVPLPTRGAVTFFEFETTIVLPKGASYGISYKPETGSTSVDVIAGVTVIKVPLEFI